MSERKLTTAGSRPELVHITEPQRAAAGRGGIVAAVDHARRYMRPLQALRASLAVNQVSGFDCPGCAWPDPDGERSGLGEYCENGMKALAEEAQAETIGEAFFAQHSIASLRTWSPMELGKAGRLAEPLYRAPGETHYRPVAWEQAFSLVADKLNTLTSPHRAVFYTSGRTSNEAAFLYQLFVRQYGTNNLPDCSNLCHESSGVALSRVIGIGKGTVTLADFDVAELVIVVGQNPGTNHPRMLSALERCKERGGKIIAINPLPEAGLMRFINPQRPLKFLSGGTALADLHLPVTINGDIPLLKAIMWLLLRWEDAGQSAVDWAFVREHTQGVEELLSSIRAQTFEELVALSGVQPALIEQAAQMITSSQRIIACWAMGITQHENGTENVQEIVNLLLLRGAIGKPGAGVCPVRGHSNVQGDRTMGVWERLKPEFGERLKHEFNFEPPQSPGYAAVEAVQAMYEGAVDAFFSMGGNFVGAMPDTDFVHTAMQRCALTVSVATKLNHSHVYCGQSALILPCLGRTEVDETGGKQQFVTTENSMGVVQRSQGILKPCSPLLKSEVAIVGELAQATLGESHAPWAWFVSDYDAIRDAIARTIPGFDDYNERVRKPFGFYLPNGPRERVFTNAEGKALFTVNAVPQNRLEPGEFWLTSLRSHDQYNTTVYGLEDRYRGIFGTRYVLFMNSSDMASLGLERMGQVTIINDSGGTERKAVGFRAVPYAIPKGCVAAYFPEINPVIPRDKVDKFSKTPASKSVRVRILSAGQDPREDVPVHDDKARKGT